MSCSLGPHGLQNARLSCPLPSPRVWSHSCPLNLVIPSNHLILCCPPFLVPSIIPSIKVFSNESVLHIRCSKFWSFSFSISLSNEYSGLISFRIDWFDLLAVQRTLTSLLQHHTSKASILWCSSFFSCLYMTTGQTIALTRQTFASKVMSLVFKTLSRFVTAFLPRSKCLNFAATVTICRDFGAQENKICCCFYFFSIYLPWSDGTRCHDLNFLNVEF